MSKNTQRPVQKIADLSVMEKVLIEGDLSVLSPQERFAYYTKVCESLGLNPLTKPFEYLQLDGKLVLYVKRDATDQLRKLYAVSITIVNREKFGDVYCVTARGTTPDGRTDESIGVVALVKDERIWDPERYNPRTQKKGTYVMTGKQLPLSAEELANALMKAEAKAKRRVTLSLVGLGMMDESEIEMAENAERIIVNDPPVAPNPALDEPAKTSVQDTEAAQIPAEQQETKQTQEADKSSSEIQTEQSEIKKTEESAESSADQYKLLDAITGTSPKGVLYAQLKVEKVNSGEKLTVLIKEEDVIRQLDTIKNDSLFQLMLTEENGYKIVNSFRLLGAAA